MKLQKFTPENCAPDMKHKHGTPKLYISKHGGFHINKAACERICLNTERTVMVLQDEENPKDWYISEVPSEGFKVRVKDLKSPRGVQFNSTTLKSKFFESLKLDNNKHVSMLIGQEITIDGLKLFPIITKSAAQK